MFSPYAKNPNRTIIPAIITALDEFYGETGENVEADIIAWLKNQIPKLSETDIEFIEQWFKARERCPNCGKKLITTFTKVRAVGKAEGLRTAYQFCPDCQI